VYVACYTGYGNHLDDGGDPDKLVHHLVCVDRDSGKLRWDCEVPGALKDKARQVQINEHGFASPTPVSDGERIYAYFGKGGVVAIDRDGKIAWRTELGEPNPDLPVATNQVVRNGKALPLRWGAAPSPLLHGELLIVNTSEENSAICAFDKATGKLRWKKESANLEGSAISPMIVGVPPAQVLIIGLAGEVWGLLPQTGQLLWSVETGTRGGMSPTPVADAECLYAFGGLGKSHALRLARPVAKNAGKTGGEGEAVAIENVSAQVAWTSENCDVPSPILYDGRLFVVQADGNAFWLDATDGKTTWSGRLAGRTGKIYASPLLAGDRLYVLSQERGCFVYSTGAEPELLARNELAGDESKWNASPAIAGDRMFLRSNRFLYCVGSDE
jgi:outer membrane protein assembly factor BamB